MSDDKYSLAYIEIFHNAPLSEKLKSVKAIKYGEIEKALYYPLNKKHDAVLTYIPDEYIKDRNEQLKKIVSLIPHTPLIILTDSYPAEECFENLLDLGVANLFSTDEITERFFMQNIYKEISRKNSSLALIADKYDETRQKKLEIKLHEEHKNLQMIIDSLPAYVYWFGKELKYEGANSYFTQLVDKKGSDIIGKEIGSIIKSPRLFELEHSIFHSNINSISENVEVTINDKKIWLMLNLEKISNDKSVLVVAMDITKEKEIEAALKKRNAEFQNLTDSLERKVNERTFELIDLTQSLESKVKQAVEELHEKDALLSMQTRFAAIGETINNIAHQWRQPLNTLGLMVQNLYLDQISGSLDESNMEHSTKKNDGSDQIYVANNR